MWKNEDYDIIIRTRFDLYKFDYSNYTNKILDVINNINNFDLNCLNMIKINNERG
jgi:hypothetical protein